MASDKLSLFLGSITSHLYDVGSEAFCDSLKQILKEDEHNSYERILELVTTMNNIVNEDVIKIIFLDIDGVLNSVLSRTEHQKNKIDAKINKLLTDEEKHIAYENSELCPRGMELLNELVARTNAKIVISSSWRKNRTVEELTNIFKRNGFNGEIIGKTPIMMYQDENGKYDTAERGCEIKNWLQNNMKGKKVRYIILDDDSDFLYNQRENFIHIDGYAGLTSDIVYRAANKLNDRKFF